MQRVEDSYLGWELLAHRPDCKRPQWTVDVRTADAHRYQPSFGEPIPGHSCPDEGCGHGLRFRETTVRVVCTSCGVAHLIRGEDTEDTGSTSTSTRVIGYGLAPRRTAGLCLYPGHPWLDLGRALSSWPHDFLVTAERVARVTETDVVGTITQGRGTRGGARWAATAVPNQDGPYGIPGVHRVRFAHAVEGLRTVAAAAKWISAQLEAARAGEGDG